ncbi:rho-related GTP-binding protein RhoN-like isoform X2 [Limulus polyphemus]|nr:rho-related GTP-binding protein RhoN-like isoform X2 [Limulus polyphemus]
MYKVGDCSINYTVWDTSGASAYGTVRPLAYKDASVFLLCFSIVDPESLNNTAARWHPEIRQHCAEVPVILCGCQCDLRNDLDTVTSLAKDKLQPVTSEQALVVSRQIGATTYVETTSRQTGRSSCEAFEVAALAALGKLNKNHSNIPRQNCKVDVKEEIRDRGKTCIVM